MKKSTKIIIIILCIVLALGVGAYATYEWVIKPMMVRQFLTQVSIMLTAEDGTIDLSWIDAELDALRLASETSSGGYGGYGGYALDEPGTTNSPGTTNVMGFPVSDEVLSRIDSRDTNRAMALVLKLDLLYLMDRFHEGDRAAIGHHLRSRLTDAEVIEALELFSKYQHLL